MPGYSERTLSQKLGLRPGMHLLLLQAPPGYMNLLGENISLKKVTKASQAELVHCFAISQQQLDEQFLQLIQQVKDDCIIWISWYKKSAGKSTDITENTIRSLVLPTGWVDVKVCAVTDEWSGLKIVKRKKG